MAREGRSLEEAKVLGLVWKQEWEVGGLGLQLLIMGFK